MNYRGGAYSRAGTAFVGFSKQTGRNYPPRMVPYQFSINQGLALEFGNEYMRVISDGAYVTSGEAFISGITQADPAVITVGASGVASATPNGSGTTYSYAPNEIVTLAGGTFSTPAQLQVATTSLLSLSPNTAGTGYAPADTVHLSGGTTTTTPVVTVASTKVVGTPTINAAGTGGTTGTATVTGTTGTGTKFQASVTISGGGITAVNSVTVAGVYTVNPTTLTAEPVTGGGLTGAKLSITMGINAITLTTAGVFTVNAPGSAFSQASTSGSGTGATFNNGVFEPNTVTVYAAGTYSVLPTNPVSQASTTGYGAGATFNITAGSGPTFSDGDWMFLAGIGGMTQLNGQTAVLTELTSTTFALYDVYGNGINTLGYPAYTSGGTASRIYTLTTPYAEADLEYLKFTQSADVMSLTCVNQQTGTEYPPYDLTRTNDSNWTLSEITLAPTISPPAGSITSIATATGICNYSYVVTAINSLDGSESVASAAANVIGAVDIASTAGAITLTWDPVANAQQYNIYKASPGYESPIITGALYGYAGTAYGTRFSDTNIVADFSQVPPTHRNPFARGQIIAGTVTAGGTNYTYATAVVNSATGSGAVLEVVVNTALAVSGGGDTTSPGPVAAILVLDPGGGYLPGDTITISGDGTGAQATPTIGPQTGTYPGVCTYFQQRRVYGFTLNNPDTYFMSQPGAYLNFDTRIPTIASDSIIGTPWSLQVDGIQWMVPTSPGLLIMTGASAWLLAGVGSFATNVQPLTPSSQNAIPQAFSGCSPTVPPQKVNYSVLYVESKGSLYYELPYQLYALSEPLDLTENSSHLFVGHSIREHAWCEQPSKILWAVRNDGVLLSLTFLKAQQVSGWARHDTQGLYQSVCSVTEPPVDALYLAVERFINGNTAYVVERMDNRVWTVAEDCWCVDCGLSLPQPTPAGTLTASSATGLGAINGVVNLEGGINYSAATRVYVVDDNGDGPGTGASITPVINSAGTIINLSINTGGTAYVNPAFVIEDPENSGSGASATPTLDNTATFTCTSGVFVDASVGSVIRMGGGIATITGFFSSTIVFANIQSPITAVIPGSSTPLPQTSGNWTLTAPVTMISGLEHLAGASVTGLADGNVITPRYVSAAGTITLDAPATAVIVGLGFTAQLQSVYIDTGEPTSQGQRKKVSAVTARIEASKSLTMGANQPDGSVQSPPILAPPWGLANAMSIVPDKGRKPFNALTTPLYTGDVRIPLEGGYDVRGQVALQQANPLPLQVLSFMAEISQGDTPEIKASPRQQQQRSR